MFTKEYVFVEAQAGEYEGNVYDNVYLSDGVERGKFRNETGRKKFEFERGDLVEADFEVQFGKRSPSLVLKELRAA